MIHYVHTKFRQILRWSRFFLVDFIRNDPQERRYAYLTTLGSQEKIDNFVFL